MTSHHCVVITRYDVFRAIQRILDATTAAERYAQEELKENAQRISNFLAENFDLFKRVISILHAASRC